MRISEVGLLDPHGDPDRHQNEASQRNNVRWAAPPEKGPEVNVSGRGSQWKFRCSTKVFVAFISFKSITNQNRKHYMHLIMMCEATPVLSDGLRVVLASSAAIANGDNC